MKIKKDHRTEQQRLDEYNAARENYNAAKRKIQAQLEEDQLLHLAHEEWHRWRELCAALRLAKAITDEDLEVSPWAPAETSGQRIFQAIRDWADAFADCRAIDPLFGKAHPSSTPR